MNKNTSKSSFHRCENLFKRIDIYGQTFQFAYKGENKFKTVFGSFVTTVIAATILGFFAFKFNVMVSKGDTKITKYTLFKDLSHSSEVAYFSESGIDFALGSQGSPITKEFGELRITHNTWNRIYN